MKILCLSASNSRKKQHESVSSIVCNLTEEILSEYPSASQMEVKLRSLQDYALTPCQLCGACSENHTCPFDSDFNLLYRDILASDAVFMVVPHYSPLPSKLIILFEKLNEIAYGAWLTQTHSQLRFQTIKIGIIGHGGMTETPETLRYYQDSIVQPVARTLKSLGFQVISIGDDEGVTFGLENDACLKDVPHQIFPDILINKTHIRSTIKPLIDEFIRSAIS